MIVFDYQEAKTRLQERVKLIERVDMDVDYNIEGNLPSFYQLCICLFVCFSPCVYLCYLGYFWLIRTNIKLGARRRQEANY